MSAPLPSEIADFRRDQAAQFTQRATIQRPTGEPTYDPDTHVDTQAMTTIATLVRCKVTSTDRQGLDAAAAETRVHVTDDAIKFPIGTDVETDDVITITGSTYNLADIGRVFRVTDVDRREWQISRRTIVEEALVPLLNGS